MRPNRLTFFAAAAAVLIGVPAESQPANPASAFTYADLADIALEAPVAAHVRIREAIPLREERAVGVPPSVTRYYVEAEVLSLIRGERGIPERVRYLADVPNGARGRAGELERKDQYLILAARVPGRGDELSLVAPDAQLPYTPARADQLRAILSAASGADAPPAVTGIGRGFHVPGAIPGESETQIFLQTANGDPISLVVLRRPGQTPRWAVALSEIVDEAAAPPQPDTLLWYRLACTLPSTLPRQSLSEADPAHTQAIQTDYRLVMEGLGPCARNRG
jgi:hypothetical protein